MKTIRIVTILLFVLIGGFVFLGLNNNSTIGQAQESSSSSSSSGEVAASSSSSSLSSSSSSSSSGAIVLNKEFTGIWKAKVARCPECIVCTQVLPECTSGQVLVGQTCTACAHCKDVTSSSSSSSGEIITSSSSSGGTELCVDRGSIVLMLKLCVTGGKLQGVLHQGGVFDKAIITSQTVVSENEVIVSTKDKKGKTTTITLKLLGERQFRGTFADDGHTFEARKLNSFKACFAPGHEGRPFFGEGEDNNDNNEDGLDNMGSSGNQHEPQGPKNGPPFGMSGMTN